MERSSLKEGSKARKRWVWAALIAGAFASGLILMGVALFWPAGGKAPGPRVSPFAGQISPPSADNTEVDVPSRAGPMLAIVVGDLGYDPVRDAEWLDFPTKVTLSVLPFGPSSGNIAASAQSRGHCVILHVPMEPLSPSPDRTEPFLLTREMDAAQIAERLDRMAQNVPQAVGAVNHMGSAFTADAAAMDAFAAALKAKGFFFVDSATSDGSLGMEAARRAGVPAVRRDVFFDGDPEPAAMRRQWKKAISLAKERGEAVLVCHGRRETLQALLGMVPDLEPEGILPVTVRELLADRPAVGRPAEEG
jgi:polysaccharide deacetylase 2 family uncharacterized protein YibQ